MIRRLTSFVVLVGCEVGAIVALQRLGDHRIARVDWTDLQGWLADAPPEHALVAAVRVIALTLACWLLASTLLYVLARLTRVPAAVRGVSWITMPAVRRLVDGVAASTIVMSSTIAPPALAMPAPTGQTVHLLAQAHADGEPGGHVYTPTPAGDDTTTTTAEPAYTPEPAGDALPDPTTTTPPATTTTVLLSPAPDPALPTPATQPDSPETYVVVAGDNLWTIAANRVSLDLDVPLNEVRVRDIHPYWLRLIDANRAHLRSGDPDLIHPGESLVLPMADHG